MKSKPEANMKKCETTLKGGKENAPDVAFGGMKAADFEVFVQAMRDARDEVAELEARLDAARARRDLIDKEGLEAEELYINGIIGDPNYGPDSPLYGSTGRKRKSEYASGLTRKKKSEEKD